MKKIAKIFNLSANYLRYCIFTILILKYQWYMTAFGAIMDLLEPKGGGSRKSAGLFYCLILSDGPRNWTAQLCHTKGTISRDRIFCKYYCTIFFCSYEQLITVIRNKETKYPLKRAVVVSRKPSWLMTVQKLLQTAANHVSIYKSGGFFSYLSGQKSLFLIEGQKNQQKKVNLLISQQSGSKNLISQPLSYIVQQHTILTLIAQRFSTVSLPLHTDTSLEYPPL